MEQQYPGSAARTGANSSAVADQAKKIAETSSQQVREIGGTAKERALREIDGRREQLASQVERLAGALQRQREESGAPMPIFDLAADGARRLSDALRDRSAQELLQGVARNPAVVLAGSFALGFLTLRLFKA